MLKINVLSITLFLMLMGCSNTQKFSDNKVPVWVGSPYDYCKTQQEICGVGTGKSLKESDVAAKSELASFFKVQLNSSMTSSQSALQVENSNSILEQNQKESFYNVITAQVDELLEGVEIVQRFILNDKEYYSLARLKKSTLADLIKDKLQELDRQRADLLSQKARLAIYPLKKLYLERLGHERLLTMMDQPLMGEKKSEAWWKETLGMMRSPKIIHLEFNSENQDQDWRSLLTAVFVQAGYKVSTDKSGIRYLVKTKFAMNQEPINVDGFLKARVTWQATAFDVDSGSQVMGALEESIEVTARNKEQLWHRAQDNFKEKVLEKIYLLNI